MWSKLVRCTSKESGANAVDTTLGSWLIVHRIPFERALDFANKEKITELLYPLFVHNIGALLYHPTNSNRTNAVMAAAERRKLDNSKQQQGLLGPSNPQPPNLVHHHSMNNAVGSHVSPAPHSIAPHPSAGRPDLNRAHTFPTPPTSASSTHMSMGNQGNSYDWPGAQSAQSVPIDNHVHSTPNTPATTPPGASMQSYPTQQPYDSSRPMYSAPTSQQSQYGPQQGVQQQGMTRTPMQTNPYLKQEMGPPTSRAPGLGSELEHTDHKNDSYTHNQGNEQLGHGTGEEEADHEHDADYAHDNNTAYNGSRGPTYTYNSGANLGSLHGEPSHLSPEMNGSPSHQNGSSRGTPRNSTGSQGQWAAGYHSPPRAAPSSNLYNIMSDARGSAPNGNSTAENYASAPLQSTYAPSHINGTTPSTKRIREDDDQDHHSRPDSRGDDIDAMKRRKIGREGSVGGLIGSNSFERNTRPINQTRTAAVPRGRR